MLRPLACLFASVLAAQLIFAESADARKKVPATPGAQCNATLNSCNSGCGVGIEASNKAGGLASAVYDQSLCLGKCASAFAKCSAKAPGIAPTTGGTVVGCPPGALCAPPPENPVRQPLMRTPAGTATR